MYCVCMLVNTIKYVKKNPHFGLLIYINKKGEGMKMGCVECGENWCYNTQKTLERSGKNKDWKDTSNHYIYFASAVWLV